MDRITKKQVERLFELIADDLGKPSNNLWTHKGNRNVALIGGWYLDYNGIYGGYVINEIMNEAGGVKNPFGMTRRKARDMWEFLQSLRTGLLDKVILPNV